MNAKSLSVTRIIILFLFSSCPQISFSSDCHLNTKNLQNFTWELISGEGITESKIFLAHKSGIAMPEKNQLFMRLVSTKSIFFENAKDHDIRVEVAGSLFGNKYECGYKFYVVGTLGNLSSKSYGDNMGVCIECHRKSGDRKSIDFAYKYKIRTGLFYQFKITEGKSSDQLIGKMVASK